MRKKTAPETRQHGEVSRSEESTGLIAKGRKQAQKSAVVPHALDNRSHRTPRGQGCGAGARNFEECSETWPAPHPLH
jgi:hypothetical protein